MTQNMEPTSQTAELSIKMNTLQTTDMHFNKSRISNYLREVAPVSLLFISLMKWNIWDTYLISFPLMYIGCVGCR